MFIFYFLFLFLFLFLCLFLFLIFFIFNFNIYTEIPLSSFAPFITIQDLKLFYDSIKIDMQDLSTVTKYLINNQKRFLEKNTNKNKKDEQKSKHNMNKNKKYKNTKSITIKS